MATALQDVIANEVKSQVSHVLATSPDKAEAVEKLFRAVTLNDQGETGVVGYDAVKHVSLDQIRTAVIVETTDTHVDQYFETDKAVEALGKKLLHNDEFLAPITSFVKRRLQMQSTTSTGLTYLDPR